MDCTPSTLANNARCFACLSDKQLAAINSYLLCQIINGGGGVAFNNKSGTGSPLGSVTPDYAGQIYTDLANPYNLWTSVGTTSADWIEFVAGV